MTGTDESPRRSEPSGEDRQSAATGPPRGPDRVLDALRVRRNAAVGYGLATAATLALASGAAGLPVRQYPPPLAAALGFVLAFALGSLLTLVLTAVTGVRLARSL